VGHTTKEMFVSR